MATPSDELETASLLGVLQALEVELHHPGVACTRERLEQLLHPQFHEVGRSGRRYDRATVVAFLATHPRLPPVESHGFAVERLSPGMALLGYRSVQVPAAGAAPLATLRMSLWQQTGGQWQLRYHQGTPAAGPG